MPNNLLIAKRIANNFGLTPGAWQFDDDNENLFSDRPLLEDMQDASSGARDVQPRKTLRDRQYNGPAEPLVVLPQYSGDFLDKLREQYRNKGADSLQDFSSPEDMLKYLPNTIPRDLTDEFYDMNKPGPGAGLDDLKDYHDRGWDENDSPEMSEDKILRMRNFNKKCPCLNPVIPKGIKPDGIERVINAFVQKQENYHAHSVLAKFLMALNPMDYEIDRQQVRVAKMLSDFEKSLIYTKTNGWRKPEPGGVSVRLVRAEPRAGRWTFMTSSGKQSYSTIFQFLPHGTVTDPTKLHVRCSCSCPSWLFWGAQFNAYIGDYLYGRARPKVTPPGKRDPTGRFMVCKHVLACIPIVSRYKVAPLSDEVKEKLRKPYKIQFDKRAPAEKMRIPEELKSFGKQEEIKEVVNKWDRMTDRDRENFIDGLDSPGAVAFFAHRFPDTAKEIVAEKLKEMAVKHRIPSFRVMARKFLRDIV